MNPFVACVRWGSPWALVLVACVVAPMLVRA